MKFGVFVLYKFLFVFLVVLFFGKVEVLVLGFGLFLVVFVVFYDVCSFGFFGCFLFIL